MLNSAFRVVGLLTLAASLAFAQTSNVSAPFTLQLVSTNETLNGASLFACHEGAAIEGLCPTSCYTNVSASVFNLNTTYTGVPPNKTIGQPGILTYELEGNNFNLSEPLVLMYDPTSNVALPYFEPDYPNTYVAFDDSDKLNIQGSVGGQPFQPYYRWYICRTIELYTYDTLSWVVGSGEPDNPSCQKVDVKRVFT